MVQTADVQHTRTGGVVVLASFIFDMVAHVPRRPQAGESLIGTDFGMFVGGKGCNQAIAAARSGAEVRVIGRLGADTFASQFQETLQREGIAMNWVTFDPVEGTGLAFPLIEPDGQNSIVVVPRANLNLTPDDILAAEEAFVGAAVLLVQLELALPAVQQAIALAQHHGLQVLFNPAPAPAPPDDIPADCWQQMTMLLPNEREAAVLTGVAVQNAADAERAGRLLLERGCRSIVVTLGDRGAVWLPGIGEAAVLLSPFSVQQVDATAAGDAFCGALAAGMAAKLPMWVALRRASAAGALATTKPGAEPSLPRAVEIDSLLEDVPMFISEQLVEGQIYTRNDLRELFSITDATINTGIFQPAGYRSVWLFVTEKKPSDRTPYLDRLEGDTLYWQGQTEGRKDELISTHESNGLELLVFYRADRSEYPGAGFQYKGRFRYDSHTGSKPSNFVLKHTTDGDAN